MFRGGGSGGVRERWMKMDEKCHNENYRRHSEQRQTEELRKS